MIIQPTVKIITSSLTGLSILFLIACEGGSSDPDLLSGPEITMLEVSPKVETLEICGEDDPYSIGLNSGGELMLTFNLKAVNGLSQYKMDVHSNFDCHSHGRVAESTPWKVLINKEVEGTDVTITEKLPVPSDVQAGDYHFMFQALDLLGNEAEWVLYSLKVQNDGDTQSPKIELLEVENSAISITDTEPVEVQLKITDNKPLSGGRIEVTYFNPSGTEFTAVQHFFSVSDGIEMIYDFSFAFPSAPSSGQYSFVFKVYDAVGNLDEKTLTVEVEDNS